MTKKAGLVILSLFFITGIAGVIFFRLWQVKKTKAFPFSPQPSSFVFKPPSDSLKGKLLLAEGKVKKESREKDEFEEVAVEAEILQGEKLATGEESQASVEFADFAKIKIGSSSEVSFISFLPANFLVEQKTGGVNYQLLQDKNPLSVRSLHTLLTFDTGEGQVGVEDGEIRVKVLEGKAKLALVDLENETHVWELEKGDEISIDDTERRVEVK